MNPFKDAEWIMADCALADIRDKAFIYRTQFSACTSEKTKLYIAAHTQYAVFVNGRFADAGQYDDYEDYQVYDTIDITDFLRQGENELLIWHYVAGEDFSTRSKLIPGVIFSVFSGEKCLLWSQKSCLSAQDTRVLGLGEKITRQLGFTLDFDASAAEAELKPSVSAGKSKSLYPRPVKKLITEEKLSGELIAQGVFNDCNKQLPKALRMQKAELSECERGKLFCGGENTEWQLDNDTEADGIWLLYDCDESAGLLSFCFDLPAGAEILIGFGEHLDDGRVRTFVGGRNFCFRYIAKQGRNKFFYPLFRIGLRYLCFYVYSPKGKLHYAGIHRQHYPLNFKQVNIPNPLHRRIYDVGCNTLSLCMHEHYEDCPWREQALYAMDSRVQCLCGYYAFGEYEFPAANFRLMAHSLLPDGLLELCPPGKVIVNIPAFTAVFVREVYEYSCYSGDLELTSELFGTLEAIVTGFESRISENGLVPLYKGEGNWNFYEWRKGLDGLVDKLDSFAVVADDIYELPLNAFISDAFYCFSKLSRMLGFADKADLYLKLSQKLNGCIEQSFWCEEQRAYSTRLGEAPQHELTQGLMLYINAVPQEKLKTVAEHIVNRDYIPCTLSMSIYIYEALLKADSGYLDFVINHIEAVWGNMLDKGCQTFWETELGADDFEKAGSLCHGWSAVPVYIFGKYLYNI
ncbi:MAG: hypothetical protein IKD04_01810 [Clostridia bacterium]|nr:hypothetical protein [Clostridia bacterium]